MISLSRHGVNFNVPEQEDPALTHFWNIVYPTWESDTYASILPHLNVEKTFLDIGAWHGPISLIAHKYSEKCICFEPDYVAYEYLLKNIEINNIKNIIPVNLAVSNESELYIGNDELGGGGSSYLRLQNTIKCDTISFSNILSTYDLNEQNISVIKIDVEGYECELLQDSLLKEINVPKHISLHGEFFQDKEKFVKVMQQFFGKDVYLNTNGLQSIFIDKKY